MKYILLIILIMLSLPVSVYALTINENTQMQKTIITVTFDKEEFNVFLLDKADPKEWIRNAYLTQLSRALKIPIKDLKIEAQEKHNIDSIDIIITISNKIDALSGEDKMKIFDTPKSNCQYHKENIKSYLQKNEFKEGLDSEVKIEADKRRARRNAKMNYQGSGIVYDENLTPTEIIQ